ncbi:MAG: PilZ domain-containing protein [Desulfuromonas sp.]|nr:MAG: PilZ domain-containing protein [Desulfuromonas sp.]
MNEKRHFGRVSFATEAHLDVSGKHSEGHLLDISLHGALVSFEPPITVESGAVCHLVIDLSGSDIALDFNAEAVHFNGNAIGFKFTTSDPESFAHLRRLLELNTGDPDQVEKELHLLFESR